MKGAALLHPIHVYSGNDWGEFPPGLIKPNTLRMQMNNLGNNGVALDSSAASCSCGKPGNSNKGKNTVLLCFQLLLPVEGRVQAFGGLVMGGNFVLRGGLLTMRSDWWTLETVGDWGMLGRVRDLASLGLCSFLSSDLFGHNKYINLVKACAGWL